MSKYVDMQKSHGDARACGTCVRARASEWVAPAAGVEWVVLESHLGSWAP